MPGDLHPGVPVALGPARPARFEGWLLAIAANVCLRRLGQEDKRRRILECLCLEQDAPPESEEREERVQLVQLLLERLQDGPVKDIVQLKYGEPEHTTREIAQKLGIPHGTVRSERAWRSRRWSR